MTPYERLKQLVGNGHESTEWLDQLYRDAEGDPSRIPWADLEPNPSLLEWLDRWAGPAAGRALVVGCGLGDDAEELARRGWQVTAFDVSESAIDWCGRRHAETPVRYEVADLLQPPTEWTQGFDLVVEIYTVQVLRGEARREALRTLPGLVAPGGTLLLIARLREDDEPEGEFPWPLTRRELAPIAELGLDPVAVEDYDDPRQPGVRRLRAEFCRPA